MQQKVFIKSLPYLKLLSNFSETTPEFLLQYIDKETLPKFLGGTRTDSKGDPFCKEFVTIIC